MCPPAHTPNQPPDFSPSTVLVTLADVRDAAEAARVLLLRERDNKVNAPFRSVQSEYCAKVVQQVIATLTEAMRALSLQLGAPAGQKFPEHLDEQYYNDHWATEKCPRCTLEIELGWRVKGVGGRTPEEHLKLCGYRTPEDLEPVVTCLTELQNGNSSVPLATKALALLGKSG
jgi:hypothetical protein